MQRHAHPLKRFNIPFEKAKYSGSYDNIHPPSLASELVGLITRKDIATSKHTSQKVDNTFLAKPQSWGAAPRFGVFPPKFPPGRAGPPSAPPAPKTCTVTQTYKSGSPAVPGGGEGQGVVLLGAPRNESLES